MPDVAHCKADPDGSLGGSAGRVLGTASHSAAHHCTRTRAINIGLLPSFERKSR
jgi:hypothetical protein